MSDYDNKNTFILFYETDKKSEKSPDLTGKFTDENGREWRIAAWERTSQSDKNFLSGKVDELQEKQSGYDSFKAQGQKLKKDEVAEVDHNEPINLDDIPFN